MEEIKAQIQDLKDEIQQLKTELNVAKTNRDNANQTRGESEEGKLYNDYTEARDEVTAIRKQLDRAQEKEIQLLKIQANIVAGKEQASQAVAPADTVAQVKTLKRSIKKADRGASGLALAGSSRDSMLVPLLGFLCDSPVFIPKPLIKLKDANECTTNEQKTIVRSIAAELFRHVPCSFMVRKVSEKDVDDKGYASFLRDERHHVGTLSRQQAVLESIFASSNEIDFMNTVGVGNNTVGLFAGDFKASDHVPLDAMGQSFDSGVAACYSQFRVGIPLEECICPLVLTTGKLQQHAAVYMLPPNTPCVALLSPVLDLSMMNGCAESARYWAASLSHAKNIKHRLEQERQLKTKLDSKNIELDHQMFFIKKVTGLRYIEVTCDAHHRQNLLMLLHRFSKLWKGGRAVQNAVAFPVTTFGWPGAVKKLGAAPHLVFDNYMHEANGCFQVLSECEFTKEQYMQVLRSLAVVLQAIHAAGVTHMDLTEGNILCKVTESQQYHVKLVDWDTSLLIGDQIPTGTKSLLAHNGWSSCYHPGMVDGKQAVAAFDWWFICMMATRVVNIGENSEIPKEGKNNHTLKFIRDNSPIVADVRQRAEAEGSSYMLLARSLLDLEDGDQL